MTRKDQIGWIAISIFGATLIVPALATPLGQMVVLNAIAWGLLYVLIVLVKRWMKLP